MNVHDSLDGSVPSIDGDGTKEGVYFQYWDTKTNKPAYNDGPDGFYGGETAALIAAVFLR